MPISPTELTEFQKKFIEEYLSDPKKDATKAARRAGSKAKEPNKTAARLLANPKVIKGLADRREELGDDGKKPERVLEEISKIAFFDIKGKVKYPDKLKALDMMCRILAMYKDEVNIPGLKEFLEAMSEIDGTTKGKLPA